MTLTTNLVLVDLKNNINKHLRVEYLKESKIMIATWSQILGAKQKQTIEGISLQDYNDYVAKKKRAGYVETKRREPIVAEKKSDDDLRTEVSLFVNRMSYEASASIRASTITPIELIDLDAIEHARDLLKQMAARGKTLDAVEMFHRLIPTRVSARIDPQEYVCQFNIREWSDVLTQIETEIKTYYFGASASELMQIMGVQIEYVEPISDAYKAIESALRKGLPQAVIKNIFAACNYEERTRYQNNTRGKHRTLALWHGTAPANVKHILASGLKLPTTHANGDRLGKGIYFAPDPQKSYNYTRSGKSLERILFLCSVDVGNEVVHTGVASYKSPADLPHGYDSARGTNSHGGYDEIVVYTPDQVTIQAIVELA